MVALAGVGLFLCPAVPLAAMALPAPKQRNEILDVFIIWAGIAATWAWMFYTSREINAAETTLILEGCWVMLCIYFWNRRSTDGWEDESDEDDDGRDDDDGDPPHGPLDWNDFDRKRQDWDSQRLTRV